MKRIILISLGIMMFLPSNSQNCNDPSAFEIISNEDLSVGFLNGGDFFWDLEKPHFKPLKDNPDEANIAFAGGLWIGGFDEQGDLKISPQTYRASGRNAFWPGTLDDNGTISDQECQNFDRIWTVNKFEIQSVINDFNANGQIDDPLPTAIKLWPGRGNSFIQSELGFTLPDQEMAPFFDYDGDQVYNPLNGDYPVFRANEPDAVPWEMLWCVFNDIGDEPHHEFNPMKAEVRFTAYILNCTQNPIVNNTVFTNFIITNKSNDTLSEVYAGIWTDFDIGGWQDDLIGSAPELSSYFGYNGDNFDEEVIQSQSPGFGVNPPVMAVTLLNRDFDKVMPQTSPPIIGEPSWWHEYDRMKGIWEDGSPLTYGGDGYLEPTQPTDFGFPSNPNDTNPDAWSEWHEGNEPYDRRLLGSIGPETFSPGEVLELDVAYSYHRDLTLDHLQNVDLMYSQIPLIQQAYDNGFSDDYCQLVTGVKAINQGLIDIRIFPNPASSLLNIDFRNHEIDQMEIYDPLGRRISSFLPVTGMSEIDISHLPEGLFFISFYRNDEVVSKRFSVVR